MTPALSFPRVAIPVAFGLLLVAVTSAAEEPAQLALSVRPGLWERPSDAATPGEPVPPAPAAALEVHRWTVPGWGQDAGEASQWRWGSPEASWPVALEVPCQGPGVYQVRSGDWVSLPFFLSAAACDGGEAREVSLLPAVHLRGRLEAPRGVHPPKTAKWRVLECGFPEVEDPLAMVPFAVRQDGGFELTIPVTCKRITVFTKEFAPETWKDLDLEVASSAETPDLGSRGLKPGASLESRLVDATLDHGVAGARVDVYPEREVLGVVRALTRGEQPLPTASGVSDEQGWVELPGLPAGRFAVAAGYLGDVPGIQRGVELAVGKPVVLDPLLIQANGAATVRLLDPGGVAGELDRITLEAERAAEPDRVPMTFSRLLGEGATFPRLPPGEWEIRVYGNNGSGQRLIGFRGIEVRPRRTTLADVELQLLTFTGRVTYRGEPLPARLRLLPRQGVVGGGGAVSRTDPIGRFTVQLEAGGLYRVDVVSEEQDLYTSVPGVAFFDPETEVEIELPDRALRGTVMDAEGQAVPGAKVTATSLATGSGERPRSRDLLVHRAFTDDRGLFVFKSISEGDWVLRATHGGQESPAETVSVEGSDDETWRDLVVGPKRILRGRLTTSTGAPIASTPVRVKARGAGEGDFGTQGGDTTDDEGLFEIEMPPDAGGFLNVYLPTTELPATCWRVDMEEWVEEEVLKLRAPVESGRLRLHGAGPEWRDVSLPGLSLLSPEGCYVELANLAVSSGGVTGPSPAWEAEVARVAPGTWYLIDLTPAISRALLAPGAEEHLETTELLGVVRIQSGGTTSHQLQPPEVEKTTP